LRHSVHVAARSWKLHWHNSTW